MWTLQTSKVYMLAMGGLPEALQIHCSFGSDASKPQRFANPPSNTFLRRRNIISCRVCTWGQQAGWHEGAWVRLAAAQHIDQRLHCSMPHQPRRLLHTQFSQNGMLDDMPCE